MSTFRLLVTGWRKWKPEKRWVIWRELDRIALTVEQDRLVLVHGQCPYGGVDLLAEQWAVDRGHDFERNPADFAKLGGPAGPQRNGIMVAKGADICASFPGPGSRGTWDCMRKASEAGIPLAGVSWAQALRMTSLPDVLL